MASGNVPLQQRATAGNFPSHIEEVSDDVYRPTPWDSSLCSRCVRDTDCPGALTLCGLDGCCVERKCYDDADCTGSVQKNDYYEIQGVNTYGSNLNPLQPFDDPQVAESTCTANPECVAYTALGYMKEWITPPRLWQIQPMVKNLPPWQLYVKKEVADNPKDTRVTFPSGIRSFCTINRMDPDGTPYGTCRSCVGCKTDDECPVSDICVDGCCVNNPCLTGSVYRDEWVNIRYDRNPQCACPPEKPHCCLANKDDVQSFYCSPSPCWKERALPACSYICEDSFEKFAPISCQADEKCCNANDDKPPVCCSIKTQDCASDAATHGNVCIDAQSFACGDGVNTPIVTCEASAICCNSVATSVGICCDGATEACGVEHGKNVCRYIGS